MKLDDIKLAVDHGLIVRWANKNYTVIKDKNNLKAKIKHITPYILVSVGSVIVVTFLYWKENNMI